MEKFKEILCKILTSVIGFFIAIAIFICMYIVFFDGKYNFFSYTDDEDLKVISEVMTKLEDSYLGEVTKEQMLEGAISGILKSTEDPYTRYMSEEDYKEDFDREGNKYVGVGIHISYDKEKDSILVLSVMPDSPAEKSGMLSGDYIKSVDDKIVSLETYNERTDEIKGEVGTEVKLGILRNDEIIELNVVRENITANNIESKVLEGNIGYIKIIAFEMNVANQFITEYEKLEELGINSLIIDLRNNPGGLLSEVVRLADYLLPEGEIVKVVYEDGREKSYKSNSSEVELPIVTIINERSASASEILSGSLKDLNKSIIVGKNSYGKGVVQSVVELDNFDGAMVVTTSEYYTASGNKIHGEGISPDYEVELNEEDQNRGYIEYNNDLQLQKAIELLQK